LSLVGLKIGGFEVTESTQSPEEGDWYHGVRSDGGDQPVDIVLIKFLAGSSGGDALVDLSKQHDILGALDDPHIPKVVGFFEGVGALAVEAPLTASLEQAVRRVEAGQLRLTDTALGAIVFGISSALLHARQRSINHGGLRAEGVGVGSDGQIVVWGFGAASSLSEPTEDLAALADLVRSLVNPDATSASQGSLLSLVDQRMMDSIAHLSVIRDAADALCGKDGSSALVSLAHTLSVPQAPMLLPFDDGPPEQVEVIETIEVFDEEEDPITSQPELFSTPDGSPPTSPKLSVIVEEFDGSEEPALPTVSLVEEDLPTDEYDEQPPEVFEPIPPLDTDTVSFLVVRGMVGALFLTMLLYLAWRLF
jgi:hypothetical protein